MKRRFVPTFFLAPGVQEQLGAAALFALASLVIAPVFWRGLPCSDDTLPHLFRAVQASLNTSDGAPFLQWGPDLLRGYGYPIFAFYAPLSYWMIQILRWFGADFGPSLQVAFVLSLFLAGWGAYTLARYYAGPGGAFVAGLAYLFAPYLLYDAIQRGALPESLALALLPWALAAVHQAQERQTPRAVAVAAFALAGLILSHNVVPIFGLGLALLLSLPAARTGERRGLAAVGRRLALAATALFLALWLTAFFWAPGLAELQYTQSRQPDPPFRQWPRFEQHLLPLSSLVEWPAELATPDLLNPVVSRTVGMGQVLLASVGALGLIRYGSRRRQLFLLYLGLTLTCLFLASQLSWSWWLSLTPLNFIQLPTRFLGPASLGLAMMAGMVVDWLIQESGAWRLPISARPSLVVALAALGVSVSGWPWLYPLYCPVPTQPDRLALAQSTTWERWFAEAQAEVLPRWVQALPAEEGLMPQYEAGRPVNRLRLPAGAAFFDWETGPGWDRYRLELPDPALVTYSSFYFPGWQARLDGEIMPMQITGPEGLIGLALPAGHPTLEIAFQATPLRRLALLGSGLGWLLVLALAAAPGRPKQRRDSGAAAVLTEIKPLFVVALVLLVVKFTLVEPGLFMRANRFQAGYLAGVNQPVAVDFSGEFVYLGYKGPEQVAADATFVVTQYWAPQATIGVPYGFDLRVADEAGWIWNLPPQRPFGYTDYPGYAGWQVGGYARDAYLLHLLPGTPPGVYWLETSAFRRDVDQSLIATGVATGPDPAQARVGQLVVTPGQWRLSPETAQVERYAPTALANLPGLVLLGWSLPEVTWRPGEPAHLELLWTATDVDQALAYEARLLLVDAAGQPQAHDTLPVGSHYPPAEWPARAVVRDQIDWRLPAAIESGLYDVWLQNGGQTIRLGQWQVEAPPRLFEAPPVMETAEFTVEFARLAGFTLDRRMARPGETLELQLMWQALAETITSYRVFVHLRNQTGDIVGQSDAVPDRWTRPTTGWVAGEYVRDAHNLHLPAETSPGHYQLFTGLYDALTGLRLGETSLGMVEIE